MLAGTPAPSPVKVAVGDVIQAGDVIAVYQ